MVETSKDKRKEEEYDQQPEKQEEEMHSSSERAAKPKEDKPSSSRRSAASLGLEAAGSAVTMSAGASTPEAEGAGIAPPEGGVFDSTRFPKKLHRMLTELDEAAEGDHLAAAISWRPHGRCFAILDKPAFIEKVMPKYFYQLKFVSFQRQTNLYGFRKLYHGPDKGAYYHEHFLRGRPELLGSIDRVKPIKGANSYGGRGKSKAGDIIEPDFYSMPALDKRAQQVIQNYTPPPTTKVDNKNEAEGEKNVDTGGEYLELSGGGKAQTKPKVKPMTKASTRKRKKPLSSKAKKKAAKSDKLEEESITEALVGAPVETEKGSSMGMLHGSSSSLLDFEPTPMNPRLALQQNNPTTAGMLSHEDFFRQQQQLNMLQQQHGFQLNQNRENLLLLQQQVQQPNFPQQLGQLQQFPYLQDQQPMMPQLQNYQQHQHQQHQYSIFENQQQLHQLQGEEEWTMQGHLMDQLRLRQQLPSLSASEESSNMFLQQQQQHLFDQQLQQQQLQQQRHLSSMSASEEILFSQQGEKGRETEESGASNNTTTTTTTNSMGRYF